MKVRLISDDDIGWRVQYKTGLWPFWRMAYDRVLFTGKAVALMEELRGRECLGDVQSELAHIRTAIDRRTS